MFSIGNCIDKKDWKSSSSCIFANFYACCRFNHVFIHSSGKHGTENESKYFDLSINDCPMRWSQVSFLHFTSHYNLYQTLDIYLHKYFDFRNGWPKTSYLKAMDIWVVLCYITVFMCSLEYCIVITLITKDNDKLKIVAKKFEIILRILIPVYLIMYSLIYFIACSVH